MASEVSAGAQRDLPRRVAELERELGEAHQREAATAELLHVINRPQFALQSVFDAIAQSAGRLCEAEFAFVMRFDGELLSFAASYGLSPEGLAAFQSILPRPAGEDTAIGRATLERAVVQIPDVQADPAYGAPALAQLVTYRSLMAVPFLREGHPIGGIAVGRAHAGPFPEAQIRLLRSFADQAVIAIENTRLFNELRESLQQHTATADVLKVISRSTFDLQAVLDTLLEAAAGLCDADMGYLGRPKGDGIFHADATYGFSSALKDMVERTLWKPGRESAIGRALLECGPIHILDAATDPEYRMVEFQRIGGYHAMIGVPLMREGTPIGVLQLSRRSTRPFTRRQIELVTTFADQAVIAIENTRLFEEVQARTKELTESLEYQTATSEVLSVISKSPNNLQPVLDAIVVTAQRLCQAEYTLFSKREDDGLYHIKASVSADQQFVDWVRAHPNAAGDGSMVGIVAAERQTMHFPDCLAEPRFIDLARQQQSRARTMLGVPLLRGGDAVGVIFLSRTVVRPFTDRQIALVTTFANQAVVAIENARLFEAEQARTRELTEALEQQTATADVLKVISRSALELQKVLDTLVESAARLCNAYDAAIFQVFGDGLRLVAHHGQIPTVGPVGQHTIHLVRGRITARVVIDRRTIQVADMQAEADEYPESRKYALQLGYRTWLGVPLVHAGEVIGVISIRRAEVRPFTERQIELVNTFADQAVIAIENTRLFEQVQARTKELTESLEYQTATSDVLNVISRSPTDVQPVFDTIAKSAAQLCGAPLCNVFQFDGVTIHIAASDTHGVTLEALEVNANQPAIQPGRGSAAARAIATNSIAEIPDIDADPEYELVDIARATKIGSTMAVPMLKDGRPIGAIALGRFQKGRFPERQIELLRTFADQAVIAVENTRLFEEVQARNRELRVALEQQTATSELLKVIGRSTFDLQPVFETLAENAVRLCEAEHAFIFLYDGQLLRSVASHNIPPGLKAFVEANPTRPGRESAAGRAALERRTIHIADIRADPEFTYGAVHVGPMRTVLAIPMLRAGELPGVIVITRPEVRLFTHSQIALMETFADQAVIAIENARLFEEVQARNRDLTALGEVGRAVSSTLDLKVVLKTIVDRAVELSGTDGGSIFYYRGGRFELGETTGLNEEHIARFRKLDIAKGQTGLGEAIAQKQPLQVPDIFQRPSNPLRDATIEAGLRAGLIVPLFGSEGPLGALVLQRRRLGEFAPAVVSLMQAFADQSAIALENARLFNEIALKSRELEIAGQHKSQFVANMSHELRTPLAAMLGYAELLQEGIYGTLPDKSLPILTRIRSNGKHLLGLINTVLDISKIEAGQFKLDIAEYALGSIVETVMVATESLAATKKLAFTTEVAKGLPYGLGDEQRLTQVLLNLVGNAIKFTDAGEVRIAAGAANGHFTVSVSDTGPGIPREECERIFEKFRQVDSSNTRAKGGTGLGLAIAREIVEMHGGRIWVESTMGQGSTFRMELPVRAAATASAA